MADSPIATLVAQIEREFGVSIPIAPSTDVTSVPDPLRPLYSFSDGLTLPFANIYKMVDCDRTTYPDWICFGSDNYFSYFLCHVTRSPALTTWDHETHAEIEGVFGTAIDWLTGEYESFIDARLAILTITPLKRCLLTNRRCLTAHDGAWNGVDVV